ncbi:MAG: hypothetical protein J3R72DRAFT_56995 [Linnemannia gamsii]|nr:MAG: hypothetical protein J3R72DRAFT_56995 [Linnemannia gamsii]
MLFFSPLLPLESERKRWTMEMATSINGHCSFPSEIKGRNKKKEREERGGGKREGRRMERGSDTPPSPSLLLHVAFSIFDRKKVLLLFGSDPLILSFFLFLFSYHFPSLLTFFFVVFLTLLFLSQKEHPPRFSIYTLASILLSVFSFLSFPVYRLPPFSFHTPSSRTPLIQE